MSKQEKIPSLPSASVRVTPPPTAHSTTSTTWAQSPLGYPVIDSASHSVPDPEHLKSVWSSGKDATTTENSLEGIADEFPTSIPHSVQDMKSEDGDGGKREVQPSPPAATPTLAAAASPRIPSRMSVRDAHRAFQQVPPAPSTPRLPPYASPLTSHAPPQRTNPHPPVANQNPGLRAFGPYPSGIPNHNHNSPGMVYAQPYQPLPSPGMTQHRLPAPGTPQAASQPLWMPLSPVQQPAPYMRGHPTPSPYPAQLMPYPGPAGIPTGYATMQMHGHQPMSPMSKPANGGPIPVPIGRGRGIPNSHLISPVMAHAGVSVHAGMYGNGTALDQSFQGRAPGPIMNSPHMGYPPHGPVTGSVYGVQVGAGRGMMRSGYEGMPPQPNGGMYTPTSYQQRPW